MVMHDTEWPYWDQVSLNNTNQPYSAFDMWKYILLIKILWNFFVTKFKAQAKDFSVSRYYLH